MAGAERVPGDYISFSFSTVISSRPHIPVSRVVVVGSAPICAFWGLDGNSNVHIMFARVGARDDR